MALLWHGRGMARTRVSTTVDDELLQRARSLAGYTNDATLLDGALRAFVEQRRAAEIDAAYVAAYEKHPIDEPDDWGDLASWNDAAWRAGAT
jgi:hypothetical protein